MAKELPYFKFEPSEWDNGNIQICSRESKGLFVDLCSMYWNRLGELPYALALQKLCNGSKDALQELIKYEIIGVIDDQIVIQFLEEQLSEFGEVSEKRRNAAKKRWSDASALQMESKSNAIREEKNREDKIRLEEIARPFDSIEFNNSWVEWELHRKELKKKLTPTTAKKQMQFLGARPENVAIKIIQQSIKNGWTGLFELKDNFNGKPIDKQTANNIANAEWLANRWANKGQ